MTAASQNDALRAALINRHIFGSSNPVPLGCTMAMSQKLTMMLPGELQPLMSRLKQENHVQFDCDDHTSGKLVNASREIIFQITPLASDPSGHARMLYVSTVQEGLP